MHISRWQGPASVGLCRFVPASYFCNLHSFHGRRRGKPPPRSSPTSGLPLPPLRDSTPQRPIGRRTGTRASLPCAAAKDGPAGRRGSSSRASRGTSLASLCRPRRACPRSPSGRPAPFGQQAALPCWPDCTPSGRLSWSPSDVGATPPGRPRSLILTGSPVVARRWAEVQARGVCALCRL